MDIYKYKLLISNLPVKAQSFSTKRKTWEKAENKNEWLKKYNNNLFNHEESISISRMDVFDTIDIKELIIKTIYWGYSNGMRGNNFIHILENIDKLVVIFRNLKNKPKLYTDDFIIFVKKIKGVKGIGLSTYSKILYFLRIKFDNSNCFILDKRLIDVFANSTYREFSQLSKINYNNAQNYYLNYMQLMEILANRLETKGENIEQFLFIFGDNLK